MTRTETKRFRSPTPTRLQMSTLDEKGRISEDFRGLPRKVMLCMPSDSNFWQQSFYEQTVESHGLTDRFGHVLQVNSNIHGRIGFPDLGYTSGLLNDSDIMDTVDQSFRRRSESQWNPNGEWDGMFLDHEPWFVDDNGRRRSWSNRSFYTENDARFMQAAMKALFARGIPLSSYGVPRVPKTRPMNFFEMRDKFSAVPLLHGCSWIQLNYYAHPRWASGDRLDAETEQGVRESFRRSLRVYSAIFRGRQIVPALFARYGSIANRHIFQIIFEEIEKAEKQHPIRNVLYWTNPHSNATFDGDPDESVMTRVYVDKFDEVAPVLKKWTRRG